jgi:hypothetical protein
LPVLEDSSSFKTLNLRWSINGNSSVECKKGDNIIFKENYSQNAYPNNGFNGISIPIQLNEDDEYLFTYNRETFNNDNFPITGTFNTFYFFFNDNNTLNTGPILMTFKNFTGISANNLISSNSNIRYRNQILYSNNNPTLNAEPLFISGQVIDNNIN